MQPLNTDLLGRFSATGEDWRSIATRVAKLSRQDIDHMESLLQSGKFVPAGQILRGAGIDGAVLFNSFVVADEGGSLEEMATKITDWTRAGIGVGVDAAGFLHGPRADTLQRIVRTIGESQQTLWDEGSRRTATMIVAPFGTAGFSAMSDAIAADPTLRHLNLAAALAGRPEDLTREQMQRLSELVAAAWRSGNPGFLFLDAVNRDQTVEGAPLSACNACAENFLTGDEGVPLGSLNLPAFVVDGNFDETSFVAAARAATRFLDDVIDASEYPSPLARNISHQHRRVGLGVMGLDTALRMMGLSYGEAAAVAVSQRLAEMLRTAALAESEELASERGPFSASRRTVLPKPRRNASLMAIAPTGGISSLFGVSSGIEPSMGSVLNKESCKITLIDAATGAPCPLPDEIEWRWHLAHLLSWQNHTDGGVSKTLSVPHGATPALMEEILLRAWTEGAKAISFFRSGSRTPAVYAA